MSTTWDHPRIREVAVVANFFGGPADGQCELVLRHLLPEGLRPYCNYSHGTRVYRYESRTAFTAAATEIEVYYVGIFESMGDLTER